MKIEKAQKAARILRTSAPIPFQHILEYIEELETSADEILVSAKEEHLLRQNQGKAQVLRELLETLNT